MLDISKDENCKCVRRYWRGYEFGLFYRFGQCRVFKRMRTINVYEHDGELTSWTLSGHRHARCVEGQRL